VRPPFLSKVLIRNLKEPNFLVVQGLVLEYIHRKQKLDFLHAIQMIQIYLFIFKPINGVKPAQQLIIKQSK
jgi:hypothetical protein